MLDDEPLEKPYLRTPREGARFLNISVESLKRLVKRGDIAYIRVGVQVRFRPEDLAEYLDRNVCRGLRA